MASQINMVAQTIYEQLGGGRFKAMTGANNFVSDHNTLQFRIPQAKNGINRIEIKLNGRDLYDVGFMRVFRRGGVPQVREIAKHFDVWCDGLQELFTRETGLHTRL